MPVVEAAQSVVSVMSTLGDTLERGLFSNLRSPGDSIVGDSRLWYVSKALHEVLMSSQDSDTQRQASVEFGPVKCKF